MTEPDTAWVGASLDWIAWGWGRQAAGLRAAREIAAQIEAQVGGLEAAIRLDVRSRLQTLAAARASLDVAEVSVGQAEENLRILDTRHKAGTVTTADLLDGETALARARSSQAWALYEGQRAGLALEKAVGTRIWDGEETP
jgi:outer membrane protein TolC